MSISLLSLTGAVGVCLIGVLGLATIWFFSVVRTMDELLFCDKNLWFSSFFLFTSVIVCCIIFDARGVFCDFAIFRLLTLCLFLSAFMLGE